MFIDTHLHLVDSDFDIDLVVSKALLNDVKYLLISGSDLVDNKLNVNLLSKYNNVFLSVGYHPCCASEVTSSDFEFLEEALKNDRVVAIGEIGLDYHYGKDDMDLQKALFRKQLDLATLYDMPVVIHTRDAFLDTYNILKEYNVRGVIHCFSGSLEVCKKFLELGFYIGVGGVVTFANSNLKNVIKEIGLDRVVFETDSPYLSPFRGEKNEPCNVPYICKFLADFMGLDFDFVRDKVFDNSCRVFDLYDKM